MEQGYELYLIDIWAQCVVSWLSSLTGNVAKPYSPYHVDACLFVLVICVYTMNGETIESEAVL